MTERLLASVIGFELRVFFLSENNAYYHHCTFFVIIFIVNVAKGLKRGFSGESNFQIYKQEKRFRDSKSKDVTVDAFFLTIILFFFFFSNLFIIPFDSYLSIKQADLKLLPKLGSTFTCLLIGLQIKSKYVQWHNLALAETHRTMKPETNSMKYCQT